MIAIAIAITTIPKIEVFYITSLSPVIQVTKIRNAKLIKLITSDISYLESLLISDVGLTSLRASPFSISDFKSVVILNAVKNPLRSV